MENSPERNIQVYDFLRSPHSGVFPSISEHEPGVLQLVFVTLNIVFNIPLKHSSTAAGGQCVCCASTSLEIKKIVRTLIAIE